jgi:hypothetical protein
LTALESPGQNQPRHQPPVKNWDLGRLTRSPTKQVTWDRSGETAAVPSGSYHLTI